MKAIYAGSFDPFTEGHMDIVVQASNLFDTVYVVIARNGSKNRRFETKKMYKGINKSLGDANINNVKVMVSDDLIVDLAMALNCVYLVRGLRNPNDYYYEENLAKINAELCPNLKTVYFRGSNEMLSSSFVYELFKRGKDVSKYVSPPILECMEQEMMPKAGGGINFVS